MAKAKNVSNPELAAQAKADKEAKAAQAKADKEAKAAQAKAEKFETLTFSDPFNGLVTIESEDGELYTITQHRKGNAVTATSLDEANNEAKKYVEDTQF